MKVKLSNQVIGYNGILYGRDAIIDVDDTTGARWLKEGKAVLVDGNDYKVAETVKGARNTKVPSKKVVKK